MCGIGGLLDVEGRGIPDLQVRLDVMNRLQAHRGPDGVHTWQHPRGHVGFAHRRLSIIDLATGDQPMSDGGGNWVTYNGEIYNYLELRDQLGFVPATQSDTEVILHAYRKWGPDCVQRFHGMFAFALWDEARQVLFCARDRFGIKPFYFMTEGGAFYFASEAKALLPFLRSVETDVEGFKDYLAFQFCLAGKTLFKGISELPPGHVLEMRHGPPVVRRYWEVYYHLDFDHTATYFEGRIRSLLEDSVRLHLRSDVPVGATVSGGLDSSIVASLAGCHSNGSLEGFTGRFPLGPDYDEGPYARTLAEACGFRLHEQEITAADFVQNLRKVVFHLDYPVAGPGSFPQFMVARLVSRHRKVVLGGHGGDEIFGGYVRYLIAYFEQCIKAAIDGTMKSGNFIVTYESIIPNLTALRNYKPLLQEFWREGLFEDLDKRYFRLINRTPLLRDEVNWEALSPYSPYETFRHIFRGANVEKESYFDSMTHLDFKTLLPALLHVEDRVSMAHGVESRVPFLDHPLVELAATIPSNIKFKDGTMKHVLRNAMRPLLPPLIAERKDKMGFPVPLTEWSKGEARDFVYDILSSRPAAGRSLINNRKVLEGLSGEPQFSRKLWGFLCLELWQQEFHDKEVEYKALLRQGALTR